MTLKCHHRTAFRHWFIPLQNQQFKLSFTPCFHVFMLLFFIRGSVSGQALTQAFGLALPESLPTMLYETEELLSRLSPGLASGEIMTELWAMQCCPLERFAVLLRHCVILPTVKTTQGSSRKLIKESIFWPNLLSSLHDKHNYKQCKGVWFICTVTSDQTRVIHVPSIVPQHANNSWKVIPQGMPIVWYIRRNMNSGSTHQVTEILPHNDWTVQASPMTQLYQWMRYIPLQWSLLFKTTLFNNSLHFKTGYQWHHLYIFSINIPLF